MLRQIVLATSLLGALSASLPIWGQATPRRTVGDRELGLVGEPAVESSISAPSVAASSPEKTFAVAMSTGSIDAGTVLVSGKPAAFSLPAVNSPTIFARDYGYQIVVPTGATRLEVRLATTAPTLDMDLFVRFGADVDVSLGLVVADYASARGGTSNEIIAVRTSSSPPLQAGTYYIAVGLYSTGVAAAGTILATVDTGPTLPIGTLLTSGTPVGFSFGPVSMPHLFNFNYSYGVMVPAGAVKLEVQVRTATPGANLDLFVRVDDAVATLNNNIVSDYASQGSTGDEIITITPSSTPPLRGGTYYMALDLLTLNTAVAGTIVATVTAGPASPAISVTPALDFGGVPLGQSKNLSLLISNTGGSTLTVNSVTSSNSPFRSLLPSAPFTVPPSGVQAFSIQFQPSALGAQTSTLSIASNDPVRSTVNVTLTGSGQASIPLPAIAASTASLSFTGQAGGPNPTAQTFTVRNSGGGTLNFQITTNQAWLSVLPAEGSSSGSDVAITASVNTSGLARGSFTGEIRVAQRGSALSAIGADSGQATPVAIAVLLTVTGVAPVVGQVVNGASFRPGMVPGSLATLFGTSLSPVTGIEMPAAAVSYKGVTVKVEGRQVPLFAIANVNGQEQINFQVPFDLGAPATARVEVNNNGSVGSLNNVQLLRAQPGIFEYLPAGASIMYAVALKTDYSVIGSSNPAARGDPVSLFLTGLGVTLPNLQTGQAGPSNPPAVTFIQPIVEVGGARAEVLFSGYAPGFLGLYQINVTIPATTPSGAASLVVSAGDVTSQTSNIAVQ